MRIEVHGQNIDVTPALREYVATRFSRLGRHFDQPFDVRTILLVEKTRQCAEATVVMPGRSFHAVAEGVDMYAAIDNLADKLDRGLLKYKERRSDHHRGESLTRSAEYA
ncbi:ribosome-associated translation inhibitor RaiA [Lysobacter sp. TY2-98]|uniref:ribosome hibernation-promoting factor, HPF/YfiA family n=1 Tax=Lysobacter sp. TY2-98 TaxID=2290922 RepID=UPI000E202802|nr:ribosome-associated translation inhibitor RaiA [Lysobacter sp. TY2-98]AXK71391.1 ribosome-associated translation inhibitor RaiA [Lysobacter sp. TY2-98]